MARVRARVVNARLLKAWPLPSLEQAESKEDRGRVLIVGGSAAVAGAVVLAAEAALRAGAGKLQIATAKDVALSLALRVPEAKVFALPSKRGEIVGFTGPAVDAASQADAVLMGCGMEPSHATARVVAALVSARRGLLILDAGALHASHDHTYRDIPVLMTPHLGEMAAMTGQSLAHVSAAQHETATDFARQRGVSLALKGAETVVSGPQGQTFVFRGGCVGLGTSGSGDVLAGIVAGLAARGADPVQALVWGVALHGESGRRLTRRVGSVGFLAREIAQEVPHLLRAWERVART